MSSNNAEDLSQATIDLTKTSSSEVVNISSNSTIASPKSDTKKSPGDGSNKSRRKRKPKKVSTSHDTSISENEEPMDIDQELTSTVQPTISISSEASKPESDCETIEKIAKMVSNITSVVAESASQEVINEVENRLEEMFADDTTNVPQNNVVTEQPVEAEKVNEENGTEPEKPKTSKPKAAVKRKKVEGSSKKQKKGVNGNKAKDNKKGDKLKKLKNGNDKNKNDKQDGKKSQKSKENGKSKVKVDTAPYLQIQKDGSFTIVNQTLNGDEDTDKSTSKQKKPATTEKHRQHIRGLHVSTLSNKYDADKRDTTWVCVFCKLGPHKFKLGDLFGPYIISKTSTEYLLCVEDPANDIFRQTNKDKFVPVIKSPTSTPKRKKKNSDTKKLTSPAVNGPDVSEEVFTGMIPVDENTYEIWFHEDCIVWSSGTHIIGTKIIGLESAVWQATRHRCEYCQKNGAMLSCLNRGCSKEAHVICASKTWKLCDDFKTYCEQHVV